MCPESLLYILSGPFPSQRLFEWILNVTYLAAGDNYRDEQLLEDLHLR